MCGSGQFGQNRSRIQTSAESREGVLPVKCYRDEGEQLDTNRDCLDRAFRHQVGVHVDDDQIVDSKAVVTVG